MKTSTVKYLLSALLTFSVTTFALAQDDDGIYGDIYQAPQLEESLVDTSSPLDGYSTIDDYYPEGGYSGNASGPANSEQYVDGSGNNITNNYYGDYYEDDNDFFYASRINRFHRPMYGYGYYDPFYTNMYYYTYDPFFWGTSIYAGYWPNYGFGWNTGWGWNSWGWNSGWGWNAGWGWNSGWGVPACYGGWGGGWGGGYWNGYNHGYWNGFNDGLAYGGYYNTYDSYSGIYNGPRGSDGLGGSDIGSGYRNNNLAAVYNEAAITGKVPHANKGGILSNADVARGKGTLANDVRANATKGDAAREISATDRQISNDRVASGSGKETAQPSKGATERNAAEPGKGGAQIAATPNDRVKTEVGKERAQPATNPSERLRTEPGKERGQQPAFTPTRSNPYDRGNSGRVATTPQRTIPSNIDRGRNQATRTQPRVQPNVTDRSATYQRGNSDSHYSNRQQQARPNVNQNGYNRSAPNSNSYRQQPSGSDSRYGNQYARPSNDQRTQPSRNLTPAPNRGSSNDDHRVPSRNYSQPSTPSRGSQPSRNFSPSRDNYRAPSQSSPSRGSQPRSVSPSPSPNRGSYSAPSRPSSPSISPGSGSRGGGGSSSPSRGGGGSSGSRGGRP